MGLKKVRRLGIGLIIICFASLISVSSVFGQKKATKSNASMTPLQLVQSGRYAEALPQFKEMAKSSPRDPSVNYYLGLCAESVRDYNLAELVFCRIVVAADQSSPFMPLARKQLLALPHHLEPQCCFFKGHTRLWDQSAYPLRIFVSDGRTLTKHLSGVLITPEEYKQVVATIRTNLTRMPISPSYKPEYMNLVAEGIHGWDWAVKERLFSYTFVRDPRLADIVILYCEQTNGYTHFPYDAGDPVVLWIGLTFPFPPSRGFERNWIRDCAAHEFGHSLGLRHSLIYGDLMEDLIDAPNHDDRQAPDAMTTANDKASLRALYSMPGDFIMYPVK